MESLYVPLTECNIGYIPGGIADMVNDAVLDFRFREHRLNGGGEAGEVIRTGNEDVLYAAVSQAIEYGGPVLGALVFAYPHTKHIFPAIQIRGKPMRKGIPAHL